MIETDGNSLSGIFSIDYLFPIIVYSIVVNVNSTNVLGRSLLPNPSWIMLIFGVAPTLALAGIGLAVLVSVRVRGFREAQQISGLLLIPILMLIFGQVSGAIIFGLGIISLLIVCLIIVDFFVFYFGTKLFRREEILSKLKGITKIERRGT